MAGGINHVIKGNIYCGWSLLENRGDAVEAVEEFAFIVLDVMSPENRVQALEHYYACCRGEKPWPSWWRPDFTPDGYHLPPQRRRR